MARTTALNKIEASVLEPTFYKVVQGGMSAGKTFAIMTLLIGYAESFPGSLITVAGMTYDHLKRGAIRDFRTIMTEQNRWKDEAWNKSEKIYYFPNGSTLEFVSVDKMGARGPRRDVLFANECNEMLFETFEALADRTRDFVIIDFNPSAEFWAHTELIKKRADRTSFLILTQEDNEALSDRERENILSKAPKPGEEPSNWWTVYGLGQIGSLEGNVYQGWIETTADEIRKNARLVRYGLDFGFSNDETGMVAIYEIQQDGSNDITKNRDGNDKNKNGAQQNASHNITSALFVQELVFEKGILGSKYPEILKSHNIDPNVLIVADGARPEIIAEIKEAGYRIIAADKNPGSVKRGIDRVQDRQIYYSGKNLKQEYLSYAWRKKRTGEVLDEPQDGNDHLLDALRYAIDDLNTKKFSDLF